MKNFRRLLSLLLALTAALSFTACGEDDGSDYIFKYDIVGNPRTLDPQTATEDNSYTLIANIFEGLLTLDGEGEVIPGVAESYTVSDDGLIYTFKLRNDVKWSDGRDFSASCTANDFVFAFQRLFNPAVKSTKAEAFFCIRNGEEINNGSVSDLSTLGVSAGDDYTLTISLKYPNPMLPVLLTTAPAMPCNEEFYYKTDGQYGLNAEAIASNGAFWIYSWSYDEWSSNNNNLILRRNKLNNGDIERIYPYGLNFFIDEADTLANFTSGAAHALVTSGNTANTLIADGYKYLENDNAVWGIVLNATDVFSNENLRTALAMSLNREELGALPGYDGYSIASELIPQSIHLGAESYRSIATEKYGIRYDAKSAKNYFDAAASELGLDKLSSAKTLIMRKDDAMGTLIGYVLQQWQSSVGFFCNISVLSESEFNEALTSKSYDLALVKYTGDYNSPSAYFEKFSGGAGNYSGYSDSEFNRLVYKAEHAVTLEDALPYYSSAEKLLLSSGVFIPLCRQTEYFFLGEHCEDIDYNPFAKTISFRNAKYLK